MSFTTVPKHKRLRLETKASAAGPETGLLAADDETGVVEAIVSVTGIVDEDDDIIEPGSYAATLAKRRPKGIFSHDWKRWASRTEAIEEWPPGDPRLPEKTKDGQPWPAQAGALYVKTRYNLNTDVGRNAYHDVKFYSEVGECEWSIGYRVPKGMAVRGKDGIRRIKGLDLYEYSPVLFGAASLSGTLSVKSAGSVDGNDGYEIVDDLETYEPVPGDVAAEPAPTTTGEAVALDAGSDAAQADDAEPALSPQDPSEGSEVDEAATEDGETPADEPDGDEAGLHAAAIADAEFEAETVVPSDVTVPELAVEDGEGPDEEPDGDEVAQEAATNAEDDEGPADGKTTEGAPAYAFTGPGTAGNDAPGSTKAGAPGVADTPADEPSVAQLKRWYLHGEGATKIRWGTPGDWERCVRIAGQHMDPQRAKGFCANLHKSATGEWPGPNAHAGAKGAETVESSRYPFLPGTYEELRDELREAAAKLLTVPMTSTEVVGTWPDRVVVTACLPGEEPGAAVKFVTYEMPYAKQSGTLILESPMAVQLTVSVPEGDDNEEPLLPFAGILDEVATGVKALCVHGQDGDGETKAGRVLSAVNERHLKSAVENLLAVLRKVGVEINARPAQPEQRQDVVDTPDSTAPSARTQKESGVNDGMVVVNPAVHARAYQILAEAQSRREV